MAEWWTYRISDFLLFSPRTYYRLFELYNQAVWPVHLAAGAIGVAIACLLWRPTPARWRIAALLLAICWGFVAWAYYWERYATINWAADFYAWACLAEALLLSAFAAFGGGVANSGDARRVKLGFALVAFALVIQPLIGPAVGRAWPQFEFFAVAPDPTVVATLGVLAAARPRARWLLLPIPVVASFVAGGTLWAMEQPDAFVLPLLAIVSIGAGLVGRSRGSSRPER